LVCELAIQAEAEWTDIIWTKDSEVVSGVDSAYASGIKSTLTIAADDVTKSSGGTYKCEYTFTTGAAISSETALSVLCKYHHVNN